MTHAPLNAFSHHYELVRGSHFPVINLRGRLWCGVSQYRASLRTRIVHLKRHLAVQLAWPDKCFRTCQTETQGWSWITG